MKIKNILISTLVTTTLFTGISGVKNETKAASIKSPSVTKKFESPYYGNTTKKVTIYEVNENKVKSSDSITKIKKMTTKKKTLKSGSKIGLALVKTNGHRYWSVQSSAIKKWKESSIVIVQNDNWFKTTSVVQGKG